MTSEKMVQELESAIRSGKAPEFEVMSYQTVNGGDLEGEPQITVELVLVLDGQQVKKNVGRQVSRTRHVHGYIGRLGTIDLIERAYREALAERWPEIKDLLLEFNTPGYSVVAMGLSSGPEGSEHHVQVSMQVVNGRSHGGIVNEGVDTIQEVVRTYKMAFHWLAWRLLRRMRGEARARN